MALSVGAINITNISIGALEPSSTPVTTLISDTLSLSDTLKIGKGDILSDAFTFSDAVSTPFTPFVGIETLTFSDSYQALLTYSAQFNEAFNFIDEFDAALSTIALFTEDFNVVWIDSMMTGIGLAIQFNDQLSLSDAYLDQLFTQIVLIKADTFTFIDNLIVNLTGILVGGIPITPAGQPEVLVITDSFVHLLTITMEFSEVLSFSDQLNSYVPLSFQFNETLSLSDTLINDYGLIISESITLTDSFIYTSLPPFEAFTFQIGDSLNLIDPFNTQVEDVTLITDVLQLIDSVEMTLGLSDTSYLRRYLNDVSLGEN